MGWFFIGLPEKFGCANNPLWYMPYLQVRLDDRAVTYIRDPVALTVATQGLMS